MKIEVAEVRRLSAEKGNEDNSVRRVSGKRRREAADVQDSPPCVETKEVKPETPKGKPPTAPMSDKKERKIKAEA